MIIESSRRYYTPSRLEAIARILAEAANQIAGRALILFPGGWFKAVGGRSVESIRSGIVHRVQRMVRRSGSRFIVVFGLDGGRRSGNARHQLGVAISGDGVVAMGRKFCAGPGQRIVQALPWHGGEGRFERIVEVGDRRFFIAVCYDAFGITHGKLARPDVDAVLVLVHGFNAIGHGQSGDVLFARHGLAGCARTWRRPVFASTVFFDRLIPPDWPTGVRWRGLNRTTLEWRYADNPLRPSSTWSVDVPEGRAEVRIFRLGRGSR